MTRFLAVHLAIVALAIPLAACGDDDDGTDPTSVASDVERYCEIVELLETAGEEEFRELEQDRNATEEDFEAAERSMFESNEELFDELTEVAPEEIRDDVQILIGGIRERAGLSGLEFSNREQNEAEQSIRSFERENCTEPSSP